MGPVWLHNVSLGDAPRVPTMVCDLTLKYGSLCGRSRENKYKRAGWMEHMPWFADRHTGESSHTLRGKGDALVAGSRLPSRSMGGGSTVVA